jgi:hypothetical protein
LRPFFSLGATKIASRSGSSQLTRSFGISNLHQISGPTSCSPNIVVSGAFWGPQWHGSDFGNVQLIPQVQALSPLQDNSVGLTCARGQRYAPGKPALQSRLATLRQCTAEMVGTTDGSVSERAPSSIFTTGRMYPLVARAPGYEKSRVCRSGSSRSLSRRQAAAATLSPSAPRLKFAAHERQERDPEVVRHRNR